MIRFIKVRCITCGKTDCWKKPLGSWCTEQEGCMREVSEIDGNKFFYYVMEIKPGLKNGRIRSQKLWNDYIEFEEYIESKPPGERFKK